MSHGVVYAFVGCALWGLYPVYFKSLQAIAPLEILAHRVTWSFVFVAIVLAVRRDWRWLAAAVRDSRTVARFAACAALLSANWGIYIWSVNTGHVLDASLGFFIIPLVNVLLGLAFLHERLRQLQWVAVMIAAAGVLWLTWQNGAPPWASLVIAVTWGGYSVLCKTARLGALEGLAMVTMLLFPVAFGYLLWLAAHGESSFGGASVEIQLLLAAAGPVTAIPLLLYLAGARRLPLSMLGLIHYVTPTLQLLLGVFAYDEPFGNARLVGYGAIWVALAIYSVEGLWRRGSATIRPPVRPVPKQAS